MRVGKPEVREHVENRQLWRVLGEGIWSDGILSGSFWEVEWYRGASVGIKRTLEKESAEHLSITSTPHSRREKSVGL
jgi:hypothetical protein